MIYVGYRYGCKFEERHKTLDALVTSAASLAEHGFAAFVCALNDDRTVALDYEALKEAIRAKWDEWDAREKVEAVLRDEPQS